MNDELLRAINTLDAEDPKTFQELIRVLNRQGHLSMSPPLYAIRRTDTGKYYKNYYDFSGWVNNPCLFALEEAETFVSKLSSGLLWDIPMELVKISYLEMEAAPIDESWKNQNLNPCGEIPQMRTEFALQNHPKNISLAKFAREIVAGELTEEYSRILRDLIIGVK